MKKTGIFRVIAPVLLVFWMILIFILSAENAEQSSETSAGFSYWLFSVIYPDFNDMDSATQHTLLVQFSFIIRKAAHFTLYFILGILSFLNTQAFLRIKLRFKTLLSFWFSVLYAASDELHQLFVPGRAGQIRDVAIDGCGAFLGIVICIFIYKGVERKNAKKGVNATE